MEVNVEMWKFEYGNVEINMEIKCGNAKVKIISNFTSLFPFLS